MHAQIDLGSRFVRVATRGPDGEDRLLLRSIRATACPSRRRGRLGIVRAASIARSPMISAARRIAGARERVGFGPYCGSTP